MNHSYIEFRKINSNTVLTQQYSVKPLKIINPKSAEICCFCMLTNYGGGFVEGDTIALEVNCGEGTHSIISSQANTRIYESSGKPCKQVITSVLDKDAFHVFLTDPLVMHKGGVFHQHSNYRLKGAAVLLLVDWFVAGRTENGEKFAFKEYFCDTEISVDETPIIRDKFRLTPENMDVLSPALLSEATGFMNIYIVGDERLEKVTLLESTLKHIAERSLSSTKTQTTVNRINPLACVGRFASADLLELKKVASELSGALLHKSLLGFDPLVRKY